MTKTFKLGVFTVTLNDDDSARVTYTESGNLVFEGPAYEVARKLDEQGRAFERAKHDAQRAAGKLRKHTRASTRPWEVWVASQWWDFESETLKHTSWTRHASYKTEAAAERAAVKLAAKPHLNSYGEPIESHPRLTEVRRAVAESIL